MAVTFGVWVDELKDFPVGGLERLRRIVAVPTGRPWVDDSSVVRGLESIRRAQARALDPRAVEGPFPVDTRPVWARSLDRATAKAFSGVSFQAAIDEHVREQVRAEEARLIEVDDWARWWHHAREAERRRPMLGSEERPYELVVPRWVESRAEAQGETCQAIADRLFRVKVHVVVVD